MTATVTPPAVAFDLDAYLVALGRDYDLTTRKGRMLASCTDPLAFALIYLKQHLTTDGAVSFGEHHIEWVEHIRSWMLPGPSRRAYVAPREAGKSTFWFLLAPLWAGAFGHRQFVAAFSDTGTQAEIHLGSFRYELDTNALLRHDFPDLCAPEKRDTGVSVADRQNLLARANGFVFFARGLDSSTLGLKVGHLRPDLLLFDDIEPPESNYSPYQREKRLATVVNAILPMNPRAHVVIVGTVTMPGSIVHALVRTVQEPDEPVEEWITDEGFTAHYYAPILTNDDGSERSLWPARWPLPWLQERRHTRSFRLNFSNDPMARDGDYWTEDDITYGELAVMSRCILSVDPAVTTKTTSDWTGLAVVGYQPARTKAGAVVEQAKCAILHAEQVRLIGEPLKAHILRLLQTYPEIAGVLVETNQGGEVMADVYRAMLRDLPIKVETVHQTDSKEARAAAVLSLTQRGRVLLSKRIRVLVEQMVGFPKAAHDDVLDAAMSGVLRFLRRPAKQRAEVHTASYV